MEDRSEPVCSAGKRTRASASPGKDSTSKKVALEPAVRDLLSDWSSCDESSPPDSASLPPPDTAEASERDLDFSPLDLSSSSEVEEQQTDDDAEEWTLVGRGRHQQQSPRPRFKLGDLGDHENAYKAITALEKEYPTLRMQVRPNLQMEYILTPKGEDSAALLRRLAEEGNRVLLLDPSERRHRVVVERYPLDLPLDAVEAHPQVTSAKRLTSWRSKEDTRQVLVVMVGPPPEKLDLGSWGRYHLRPYKGEPVRCYKCQRFNHLKALCTHDERCGVCSQPHATEECISRLKAKEETTPKCPNCGKAHHAWNPRCPERLRRLPRSHRQQQQEPRNPPGGRRRRRRRARRGRPQQQATEHHHHQQQQQQPRTAAPQGPARKEAAQCGRQEQQPLQKAPRGWQQQQQRGAQQRPRGQRQPQQQQQRQPFSPAPSPSRSAWDQRQVPRDANPSSRPAAGPEGGISQTTGVPSSSSHHQPERGGRGTRPSSNNARAGGAPAATAPAPTSMSGRRMAPSDPLHGESCSLSQEMKVLLTALMARMAHLLADLLHSPGSAPTGKEELEALFRKETLSAISECCFQHPPPSRVPFPGAPYPADPTHHHDGEQPH